MQKIIKRIVRKPREPNSKKVQEADSSIKCLHRINPAGGFKMSHRVFCSGCMEDKESVAHVFLNYWCGNCCIECRDRYAKQGATITDRVILDKENQ